LGWIDELGRKTRFSWLLRLGIMSLLRVRRITLDLWRSLVLVLRLF